MAFMWYHGHTFESKLFTFNILDRVGGGDAFASGLIYAMMHHYKPITHLNLSQEEVWLMPFGLLLDLWECHRQYNGMAKPKREMFIDDIIPDGI